MTTNYLLNTPNQASALDEIQVGDILVSNRGRAHYAVITKTTGTTVWYKTIDRAYTPNGGMAPSRHGYTNLMGTLYDDPKTVISESTRKTVCKSKGGRGYTLDGITDGAKYYVPWDGKPVTEISD